MAPLRARSPCVAIFPWGDVIEDFLDPLGLDPNDFAYRMSGGWLFGYVAALARQGVRCVIVYASERTSGPERLVHADTGAAIWLVPGRSSGRGRTLKAPSAQAVMRWRRTPWRAFAEVLRREGCTDILVQDYEQPRFDALVLLGRALGLGVFATFQGGDLTLSPIERCVRSLSVRGADGLIVASRRERQRLAERYRLATDKLHAAPNPVDTALWRPQAKAQARQALGLSPEAFVAVNHGRIDMHRKGLDVLLAAWRQAAPALGEAELVVIGSGQDHDAFAQAAADIPRLRWIPAYVTDPAEIRTWLCSADAYVTLSRIEGMPVAPLEAMACGLPVVATDAHGLDDIFRQGEAAGGLLVPRDDPARAAAALERLAADPQLRARLGAAARREVEQTYSLEAVGAALVQIMAPPSRTPGLPPSEPAPHVVAA